MAAAFAAWYARGAFIEAKRGANAAEGGLVHAKYVSRIESRPWVSISVTPKVTARRNRAFSIELDIVTCNLGATVAKNCQLYFQLLFGPQANEEVINGWWEKWAAERRINRKVLMPQESDVFPFWGHLAMDIIPWAGTTDKPRRITPVILVSVQYQSEFGDADVWHQTDRAFLIGRKGEQLVEDYLTEDNLDLGPKVLVARPYSANLAT